MNYKFAIQLTTMHRIDIFLVKNAIRMHRINSNVNRSVESRKNWLNK